MKNAAIQELHAFIIKNENNDSDVWTIGGYDDDVIRILENLFTDFDWQELKSDLENWPTDQLEIFTHCILTGEGSHGEMTVGNRIELLPTLLDISKNRGQNTNDIGLKVLDNIEFLAKAHKVSLQTILQIAEYFDYSERIEVENVAENPLLAQLQKAIGKAAGN